MFTEEQIKNFFDRKVTHPECPVCDANDWLVAPSPSTGEVTLLNSINVHKPGERPSETYAVIQVYCNNCGYVRMHNIGVMMRGIYDDGNSNGKK
ncbi:hypothetical protein FH063_001356 [Azospirillum argentinense]|uniref:Uncharacterized protein n=1 Tax=Azospirillum argentinense TaxID=2970906 RepID=A0A5B0L0P8_9PROT|nr:hypothetical protein FH063_001356 [Azospirillum argentinense]